jgi:hypothetical protein
MEEKKHATAPDKARKCCCCGWSAFAVGLVAALILGWWALPALMLAERKQPVNFSHPTHVQDAGTDCSQCHFLRADGSFSGVPDTATCAECHFITLGSDPEEARFVTEYVQTGREIKTEWLIYQKQPDNVFFSHAVHSLQNCGSCHEMADRLPPPDGLPSEMCALCHLEVFDMASPPVYKENRLSGYVPSTKIMWECERCHALPQHAEQSRASNGCFVCHK